MSSVVKCESECCKSTQQRKKSLQRRQHVVSGLWGFTRANVSLAHSALIDLCTKPQLNPWDNLHTNTLAHTLEQKNNLKKNLQLYHGTWQDDNLWESEERWDEQVRTHVFVTLTKIAVREVSECVLAHLWWKYDAFVRGIGFGSLIISADAMILTTASSFLKNNDGRFRFTIRFRQ